MYSRKSSNGHLDSCACRGCHGSMDDLINSLEIYDGAQSDLMQGVPQSIFEDIERLPKALHARAKIIFTPHGANIGAKYGVKDYFRQISTTQIGQQSLCLKIILDAQRAKALPINTMMRLLQELQKRYVYEINVDYQKHHHRPQGEIVTLAPIALNMTVFKEDETYQEQVAMLSTEHMQIRRKDAEHINTMLPYGFTEHALKRLWERASLNGDLFHQKMADAFRVMRDRIAMAYIAYVGEGLPVPSYLAIPFDNGIIIAGKRGCWTEKMQRRYGYKVSHHDIQLLSDGSSLFGEARKAHDDYPYIGSVDWLASTYMSGKDISNYRRLEAADEYEKWSEGISEGVMPYLCERFQPAGQDEIDQWMPHSSRRRYIELQAQMQPRLDPPDERVYVYGKIDLEHAIETAKLYGRVQGPVDLPY